MDKNNLEFITIIVPCLNEEKFVGKCLEMILEQDYPKESMEILVVDGMSIDGTRKKIEEIINKVGKNYKIRILDNLEKFIPFALNIGIKQAKGDIIIRMDAHAGYEKDYISKCVKYLKEYNADNIGGKMKTLPADNSLTVKAISLVLSSCFGAFSFFRVGTKRPREVDTVFGGCYKREVFDRIGLFNEKLLRSEDMEFNLRLKKAGGKIILHPEIKSYYYPKSNLRDFLKHNIKDGVWAVYPLKFNGITLKLRHYLPLIFTALLIDLLILGVFFFWARILFNLVFGSYLILSLIFSLIISLKEKDLRLFFVLPVVFFVRHFGYGFGSLIGLVKLLFRK